MKFFVISLYSFFIISISSQFTRAQIKAQLNEESRLGVSKIITENNEFIRVTNYTDLNKSMIEGSVMPLTFDTYKFEIKNGKEVLNNVESIYQSYQRNIVSNYSNETLESRSWIDYRYSNSKCMIISFPVEVVQEQGQIMYKTTLYRVNLN